MRKHSILALALLVSAGTGVAARYQAVPTMEARVGEPSTDKITWKKFVLDRDFRSEGVAVADVNRDGKPDVFAGNMWYEAPDWRPHETAPAQKFDGEHGYSNSFFNWTDDVNKDGWPDQLVIGFPGDKALWRENPKGKPGPWPEHVIWRSACNESPTFADILGTKKLNLVFPYDEKLMAWYEPDTDRTKEFVCHTVGTEGQPGVQRFSHGFGVGDVTGDGRPDILTTQGYYEAPSDPRSGPWKFVTASLGPDCAQMYVFDVNGDGLPDVVCSSSHNIGVWWHEQKRGANGPEFTRHTIDDSFSQSHAMAMGDINKDGTPDFVTGKRFWAHGPSGDVRPGDPAVLYWYELKRPKGKTGSPSWTRHEIDNDSGVGTQVQVADVNKDGLLDVVSSNKKGVFVFLQERGRK